ncbi:membrane bound O-acyl transferase family-domain-containing protein [Trametes maxima]|nr:membrane bound O-acyl transferase family-domain-containing protein [Trametes maxima]
MASTPAKVIYEPGRPVLPFLTYVILPDVALAYIMALRPPFHIKIGASFFLLYVVVRATTTYTMGSPVDDYSFGSTVFGNMALNIALLTWLTDPIRDFRYVDNPAPLTARPFFTRIWYAFCIIRNNRLVGTSVQVANVPPPFKGTRSQFVWRRLRQSLVGLITLDLAESWIHTHHHLYLPGGDAYFPAGIQGYLARVANTTIWLYMVYITLKITYSAVSIAAVVTRVGEPADWPEPFGDWTDAYTVRRLWGRCWHQNLRRHFSHWGKFAVRTLRIPRGTFLSSQVQIHTAFALSSLLHALGDLMLGPEHFGQSVPFFVVNALAITFEDAVIALARRAGIREGRATRLLGYAWVVGWFAWSAPLYVRWMFESGVGYNEILPYSLTRQVVLPAVRGLVGR